MKRKLILASVILLLFWSAAVSQTAKGTNYSRLLDGQMRCKSNPQAGKFLLDLQRDGFINRTYVVEDTISYFKLHKPLRVLGFSPVAVFGFQEGFEKFFERGPGTLPPEMIGIIVRGEQNSVKLKLRNMGIDNLEIEPHEYDINGHEKLGASGLVSIACWAN